MKKKKMTGEHEGKENPPDKTKDLKRVRQSLIEEMEAINYKNMI